MKRILINGTQPEELRVAIVDGQKLENLDIEIPSKDQKISSIYKGKITRVEPSLEAAFVEYGAARHGFLPFKEIIPYYYKEGVDANANNLSIKDAVAEGTEIILQIEKEERGTKGAAITTKVSLAGRYSVLMPTEPRAGGVSRRIEGEDRREVQAALKGVEQHPDMGCIVRTAGVGRSTEELQWDLDYLVTIWEAIERAAESRSAPFLIYQDSDLVVRAMRDHYSADIGEILIDDKDTYTRASNFIAQVMPNTSRKLKHYEERTPLFNRFQIESQIESAFNREVQLPSGGAIVVDPTEALTSIDINSARATKGSDIEETARNTNVEAAREIARQLRLRDLGGLFVIDFIDMHAKKNQREVERQLKDALAQDRARVQVGRISRFGLLEMSRQRLRPSLDESSRELCPTCTGQGSVRGVESLALSVLRLIEEEASKEKTGQVAAHLPIDVATYLLNEKRDHVMDIEKRYDAHVMLVPDENYKRPHYRIDRVRSDDKEHKSVHQQSYQQAEQAETPTPQAQQVAPTELAAVRNVTPDGVAPGRAAAPVKPGIFVRMWRALFGTGTPEPAKKKRPQRRRPQRSNANNKGGNKNQNRNKNRNNQRKRPQNKRGGKNNQNKNNQGNKNKNQRNNNKQQNQNKGQQNAKPNNKQQNQGDKKQNNNANANGNTEQSTDAAAQATQRGPGRRNNRNRNRTRNRNRNRNRNNNNKNAESSNQTQANDNQSKPANQPQASNDSGSNQSAQQSKPKQTAPKPSSENAGNVKTPPAPVKPDVDGNSIGNAPAKAKSVVHTIKD